MSDVLWEYSETVAFQRGDRPTLACLAGKDPQHNSLPCVTVHAHAYTVRVEGHEGQLCYILVPTL